MIQRFPRDFIFQLTDEEKDEVVANCDHLKKLKYSLTKPFAFPEHGAIMLAAVLNIATAIQASVLIVRAFVKLREILAAHKELALQLAAQESKYDQQFGIVSQALIARISTFLRTSGIQIY